MHKIQSCSRRMYVAANAAGEETQKNARKNAEQRNKAFAKRASDTIIAARFEGRMGRYPSGQRGQTVNLLAYAYAGSNPALPTTFILSELKTKAPPQRRGFFFECSHFVATFSIGVRLPNSAGSGIEIKKANALQFPSDPRYKYLSDRGFSLAVSSTHNAPANPLFALHQPGHRLRVVS
jgi:hypothetical protein